MGMRQHELELFG